MALARALAGQPSLLLLDEPLSALDAGTRLDVQAELKRHLADFAGPCLLVTHDPIEALVLADQLVVLEHGRIVQEGTPALVARQPGTDYVARLVGLNLYAGRADGSAVALAGGGAFVVPDHGQHGEVLVAVRPSAIVVSTQPPQSSSARNAWQAKITGLTLLADRVRLDLDGPPPALVDVTPAAVAELSLDPAARYGSPSRPPTSRSTPTTARKRAEALGRHRLDFGVGLEGLVAHFAAHAGLLVPAERQGRVEDVVAVDPDGAGAELLGQRVRLGDVLGPDPGAQAVAGVVRLGGDLVQAPERLGHHDRAEDFLAGDLHVRAGVGDDGGLDEVALVAEAAAAGDGGGPSLTPDPGTR